VYDRSSQVPYIYRPRNTLPIVILSYIHLFCTNPRFLAPATPVIRGLAFVLITKYIENAQTGKIPVDFLSNTLWETLIFSLLYQSGAASEWNGTCNFVGPRGSLHHGCTLDTDALHDTELKPWKKKASIRSHLYCIWKIIKHVEMTQANKI
jgi:hypothetical protein